MSDLKNLQCIACQIDAPKLTDGDSQLLIKKIPEWTIKKRSEIDQLERVFTFSNFKYAIEFTDKVAAMAENQAHHPKLITEWGKVTVTWWSHKIKGLHQNDFICAAKTDELICAGLKL